MPLISPTNPARHPAYQPAQRFEPVLKAGLESAVPRRASKTAAANALALAAELQASPNDVPAALARWEPPQVALGKYLRQQGSQIGDYLLFHRQPISKVG